MLKIFIEYSNDKDEIYKNIEEYSPNKNCKIFIVFDNMVADMLGNQKPNPIVTEYFIRGRKLNISLVFITQSYFAGPKNIRLNSTPYFIMKISQKRQLQQTEFNLHKDIDCKDFMNFNKEFPAKPYSFLLPMLLLHQIIIYVSQRIF